jgi:cytochrome c biogenesis protein CcdA
MTLAVVLSLATQASHVTSGAVLTLVLPLGLTLIALLVWVYFARRAERKSEPPAPPAAEPEPTPGPASQ